jgi:hypothetical protein
MLIDSVNEIEGNVGNWMVYQWILCTNINPGTSMRQVMRGAEAVNSRLPEVRNLAPEV